MSKVAGKVKQKSVTMLLIENDFHILEIDKKVIELLGLSEITARSGSEALRILKNASKTIDIVKLDLALSDNAANEIFDEIREINSHIPVIVTANDEGSEILSTFENEYNVSVLIKPYGYRKFTDQILKYKNQIGYKEQVDQKLDDVSKNENQTNKRQFDRYIFSAQDQATGDFSFLKSKALISTKILNISKGGICIALQSREEIRLPEIGDRLVLVRVSSPEKLRFLLNIDLEVRWTLKHESLEQSGVGCQFIKIPQSSQKQLQNFLEAYFQGDDS
jgi:response regulator RpfG family c-di-GMP phosphodiesterase